MSNDIEQALTLFFQWEQKIFELDKLTQEMALHLAKLPLAELIRSRKIENDFFDTMKNFIETRIEATREFQKKNPVGFMEIFATLYPKEAGEYFIERLLAMAREKEKREKEDKETV